MSASLSSFSSETCSTTAYYDLRQLLQRSTSRYRVSRRVIGGHPRPADVTLLGRTVRRSWCLLRIGGRSATPSVRFRSCWSQGDGEVKGGAYTCRALDPDPAAVCLDNPFGNGQPQSGAKVRSPLRLPVSLEDVRQILRPDAWPGVSDRELNKPVDGLRPNGDCSSFGGELECVPDQIREDLLNAIAVR